MKNNIVLLLFVHLLPLCVNALNTELSVAAELSKCVYSKEQWDERKQGIWQAIEDGVSTVDIQEYGTWGHTPLAVAVCHNDMAYAEELLKKKANPNFELQDTLYNRIIFAAQSVAMLQLLEKYGADLKASYFGLPWKAGMNLLHSSISCLTRDEHIFDYCLTKGLDAHRVTVKGDTLWHSLARHASQCPEKYFIKRAQQLHALKVSSRALNQDSKSVIDEIQDHIQNNKINPIDLDTKSEIKNKLENFIKIVKNPGKPI
ncbi:MAG: hypothetical protein WCE21_00230 [Candidatus Babeliales bacterium]